MNRFILICIMFIIVASCNNSSNSGDSPYFPATPVIMFDGLTIMGQKIQSNGYEYNPGKLDDMFNETMFCLEFDDIPADIYIKLKEPYSAFPCIPLINGCGGLFNLENEEPVITVNSDMIRLKHEYIHYMLWYSYGDADSNHESKDFINCQN